MASLSCLNSVAAVSDQRSQSPATQNISRPSHEGINVARLVPQHGLRGSAHITSCRTSAESRGSCLEKAQKRVQEPLMVSHGPKQELDQAADPEHFCQIHQHQQTGSGLWSSDICGLPSESGPHRPEWSCTRIRLLVSAPYGRSPPVIRGG